MRPAKLGELEREWNILMDGLSSHCQRRWRDEMDVVIVKLRHRGFVRIPLCPRDTEGEPLAIPPLPQRYEKQRAIYWPGLGVFRFNRKQWAIVDRLWWASLREEEVSQKLLLQVAGSNRKHVARLFANSPAWGSLILPGEKPGCFRLPRHGEII